MNRLLFGCLCLCVTAACASGCRRDVDERLGLDEKRAAQPLDPTAFTRGGELERAVGASAADVASRLKSWRLTETAALVLGSGDKKDSLEESWKLEIDGRGGTHVVSENSHGYGFETIALTAALPGAVYVRPRYGRYVRRVPEGDEVERAKDGVEGVLAGYLTVLGRFADRTDAGDTIVGMRKARRIRLSLAPSPSRLRDPDPAHAWRKTMKVSMLTGEIDVDTETGAPLHASLEAAWTAERLGATAGDAAAKAQPVSVRLLFRCEIDQVDAVPAIAAPEGALPSAVRTRPLVDRQALLDGLVAGGAGPLGEPSR